MTLELHMDNGGYFKAVPETLGTTNEEMARLGLMSKVRADALVENIEAAVYRLIAAVPAGRC